MKKGILFSLWVVMQLGGKQSISQTPSLIYDSLNNQFSSVIVGSDTFGLFRYDEMRALISVNADKQECSENNDSLVSQIRNADATIIASRKVNSDLRLLKQNCDSINSEKDKQIKYYLNSFRAEKDISNFYKTKSNSWIAVALVSILVNAGQLYLMTRH